MYSWRYNILLEVKEDIPSLKSLVVSSWSTDFHTQNEKMRYTIIFSEHVIKHLLEIEEFSQNRQKM